MHVSSRELIHLYIYTHLYTYHIKESDKLSAKEKYWKLRKGYFSVKEKRWIDVKEILNNADS